MNNIRQLYFDWMCDKVSDSNHKTKDYCKLLGALDNQEFTYSLPMDGNRYEDGIYLRYIFGYENFIDQVQIANELDNRPCSMLEMMVMLSIRIEEMISDDDEKVPFWFWNMIKNLHLDEQNNRVFDGDYVEGICQNFLDRNYKRDGDYSLFRISSPLKDVRSIEIWNQAMWYLNDVLNQERGF